jgi:hypothetical protein
LTFSSLHRRDISSPPDPPPKQVTSSSIVRSTRRVTRGDEVPVPNRPTDAAALPRHLPAHPDILHTGALIALPHFRRAGHEMRHVSSNMCKVPNPSPKGLRKGELASCPSFVQRSFAT